MLKRKNKTFIFTVNVENEKVIKFNNLNVECLWIADKLKNQNNVHTVDRKPISFEEKVKMANDVIKRFHIACEMTKSSLAGHKKEFTVTVEYCSSKN